MIRTRSLVFVVGAAAALSASVRAQAPEYLWQRPLPYGPRALDLSPAGDQLAVSLGRGPSQSFPQVPGIGGHALLNPATGAILATRLQNPGPPNELTFSPDGSQLGLAVIQAELRRVSDGVLLHNLFGSGASTREVGYSANGSRLFSGSTPGFGPGLHVFNTQTGELTNSFGLVGFTAAMGLSRDASRLAVADDQSNLWVFDVSNPDSEQLLRVIEDPNPSEPTDPYAATNHVFGIAFTPDGENVATMSAVRVNLYRLSDAALLRTFESPDFFPSQLSGEQFWTVAVSPNGRYLAAGGIEVINEPFQAEKFGTLNIWNLATGDPVARYVDGVGTFVQEMEFSPDSRTVYFVTDIDAGGPPPFAAALVVPGTTCYADCNGDGSLNLGDFGCFQTQFALGNPYADCNADGSLNLGDFGCFQTRFALGCP